MKTITVRAFTFFMLIAFLAVGSTTDAHHSSPIVPHDSPYDLSFIDMMMHHRQGLEMARMAESNGQLSELKGFAKRMIADQEKDITELQGYRDRFYPSERKADKMRIGDVVMPWQRCNGCLRWRWANWKRRLAVSSITCS